MALWRNHNQFRTSNMKRPFLRAAMAVMGFVLAGGVGVKGDVLYQNTSTDLGYSLIFPDSQQIGEQVWLNPLLPSEYLTNFSFEYSSPNNVAWSVTADVRIYANDSATLFNGYATPGTLLYDSGPEPFPNPLSVSGGNTNALVANFALSDLEFPMAGGTPLDSNLILPTNFTFTITFSGLDGNTVDLPVFEPPSVGTNYGDYWYDLSGNWELLTNNVPGASQVAFGAEFDGSPSPTPEPTVLCLGAFGAAMLTVMRRRQRRG
jgi:hypothetical protein